MAVKTLPHHIKPVVPGGRLPSSCSVQTPLASLCTHQCPLCPSNIQSTQRQEFPSCGTKNMEVCPRHRDSRDIEYGQFKRLLKIVPYSETAAHYM